MYLTLLLYFILGLLFLFFPKKSPPNIYQLNIERMIKEDCSSKTIRCIDDCSFLCSESGFQCINNVCQRAQQKIQCDREFGGVVVMHERNGVPFWDCICTNPSYYGGPGCTRRAPDICKDGIFNYKGLNKHLCKCKAGDVYMKLNDKDYCVTETISKFFKLV